jgi:hypothetical protein
MLKVGQVVKGYINCGVKNPFYNKPVLLTVKCVINSNLVEVETVNAEVFEHHVATFNKCHELLNEKTVYETHTYTNWLKVEKGYEIVE